MFEAEPILHTAVKDNGDIGGASSVPEGEHSQISSTQPLLRALVRIVVSVSHGVSLKLRPGQAQRHSHCTRLESHKYYLVQGSFSKSDCKREESHSAHAKHSVSRFEKGKRRRQPPRAPQTQ